MCFFVPSFCNTFDLGVLRYQIIDSSTVSVVKFIGNETLENLTIPSTVSHAGKNYTVTKIGSSAFFRCSGITGSLTIPNSVTSIGDYAFSGCTGLTGSLTIGNGVIEINYQAFSFCSGFTGPLKIPNSVTSIGDLAFYGCTGFTGSLTIPNSVTSIGANAFSDCSGFTGPLTIPNSVTEIGPYAFHSCSGLSGNLTIGFNVKSIGKNAFSNCTKLKNVIYLGTNPPTFDDSSFKNTNISSFYVDNNYTNDTFCGFNVSRQSFYKVKIVNNVSIEALLTYVDVDDSRVVLKKGDNNLTFIQNYTVGVYVTYQSCNNTLLKEIQTVTSDPTSFMISNENITEMCSTIETPTGDEESVQTKSDDESVNPTNDQNADNKNVSANVGTVVGIVFAVVVVIVVIIVVVLIFIKKRKHDRSSSLKNQEINA
ncbi:cell surface protein precursor [Tritrichomonas foetus]|uniref:Cell surface protein n=1 Tax=Tritrichomonas foetus TaxID=1144522 RepID=A0A1J4KW17_9EUKA|nr:cell surface protein precursor [Tritrichomonas foetus]|eukprot:OHT13894.1 cell surface protein precursor [Tritrichomonas foetus]